MKADYEKWLLIQRYVTGHADERERRKVERWMAESHQNRKLVQDVRELWNQAPPENFNVDVKKAWARFTYHNQKKQDTPPRIIGRAGKQRNIWGHILKSAAIILVAALAGVFVYQQIDRGEQPSATEAFNTLEELVTERGEKARVSFSDGTKVMLNSASSIRFPKSFHGTKREVYLEGEAYFEVAPNAAQPFIVHAQDAEIEVLGTEFNVRGWDEDRSVEVVVREGSVSVQSVADEGESEAGVVLASGLKTRVERGQRPEPPQEVEPVRYLLWTSGGIHFDRDPFYKVVRDIERQFNVEITVSVPSLLQIPYTGTFQHAELNEILEVIATSMEVGIRRDGANIEFYR